MNAHRQSLLLAASRLDFPLSEREDRQVSEHLRDCALCRIAVSRMTADARALRALPAPVPPSSISMMITEAAARASYRSRPATVSDTFHPLLVLAALALLMAALVGAAVAGASAVRDLQGRHELSVVTTPAPRPSPVAANVIPDASPKTVTPVQPSATPAPVAAGSARPLATRPTHQPQTRAAGPNTPVSSTGQPPTPVLPGSPVPTASSRPGPTPTAAPPTDGPTPSDDPIPTATPTRDPRPTPTGTPNGLPDPPTPRPTPTPAGGFGDWTAHVPDPAGESQSSTPAAVVDLGSSILGIGNDACSGGQTGCQVVTWTSADGSAWTRSPSDPAATGRVIGAVASGPDVILLVARAGSAAVLVSSDGGLQWHDAWSDALEPVRIAVDPSGVTVLSLEPTNAGGAPVVVRSHDGGGTWRRIARDASFVVDEAAPTTRTSPIVPGVHDLAARGRTVIAVGSVCPDQTACVSLVWRSADGRSWTRITDPHLLVSEPDAELTRVVAHGSGWSAFGRACSGPQTCRPIAFRSADGSHWHASSLPAPRGIETVAIVRDLGPLLAAVVERAGGTRAPHLWWSIDGRAWRDAGAIDAGSTDSGPVRIRDLTLADGTVIAAGRQPHVGAVFLSTHLESP